ncbi:GntR family transcriptional regulator [Streptomyces beihaiensis]|uniref:GntR family transcriptional regulator n=1 Tax=Streptomyces beihaiensis TaxID=2984495 RepID=A0ABT3U3X7_9ACTN|nr:GntR family transcriptional regulator [Streptomyces beihaiensis]MCX3064025.1 GntR family transcriptional regulator [Streptomyces beihaiensis]
MAPRPGVRVETASPVPPYEQIRTQLAALISAGRLPEGERLPAIRQLASDLGLASGTVARAYRELEAAGFVRTRRGAGTRVAALPDAVGRGPSAEDLARLARRYRDEARGLGADDEAIGRALRDVLGER